MSFYRFLRFFFNFILLFFRKVIATQRFGVRIYSTPYSIKFNFLYLLYITRTNNVRKKMAIVNSSKAILFAIVWWWRRRRQQQQRQWWRQRRQTTHIEHLQQKLKASDFAFCSPSICLFAWVCVCVYFSIRFVSLVHYFKINFESNCMNSVCV